MNQREGEKINGSVWSILKYLKEVFVQNKWSALIMWIIVILGNFLITPLIQRPQAAQHTVETDTVIRKYKGDDEFLEYK